MSILQTHEPGHPDPGLQVVYRRQFVNSGDRVGWGGDIYVGRSDYYVYLGVREARRKKTNKHSQLVIARIQQEAGSGKEAVARGKRERRHGCNRRTAAHINPSETTNVLFSSHSAHRATWCFLTALSASSRSLRRTPPQRRFRRHHSSVHQQAFRYGSGSTLAPELP